MTVFLFYSILIAGSLLRAYPTYSGFVSIIMALSTLHLVTATLAALRQGNSQPHANKAVLKWTFTIILFLLAVSSFSHSRTVMGFDRVSMAVPVMEPEIMEGEQMLIDTWIYRSKQPARGDIVVHTFDGQKGLFLNRIIAVGGDTLESIEGKLFINRILRREGYVTYENANKTVSTNIPLTIIPTDSYFVMGDNRDRSLGDSRFNGPIHASNIKGRVTYILFSPIRSRIGKQIQ